MSFFLAAFDHVRRRLCRAGGVWVDALLTARSPLTYERGDYSDGTEKLDPDYEPTREWCIECNQPAIWCLYLPHSSFGECECVCDTCCAGDHCDTASCATLPDSPVGVSTSPPVVPPTGLDPVVTHDHAAGVEASPTPPAAFQLPMYKFGDLVDVAAEYLVGHDAWDYAGGLECRCGKYFTGPSVLAAANWARHAAEPVVSALTFHLTGLAYDQSPGVVVPSTVTRVMLVHDFYPNQTVTAKWAESWDVRVQDDGRTLKLFSKKPTGPRYEYTPGFFDLPKK